jgi:hypothetical protein
VWNPSMHMTDLSCMQLYAQWHVVCQLWDRHRMIPQATHKRRVSKPRLLPSFETRVMTCFFWTCSFIEHFFSGVSISVPALDSSFL